MVSAKDVALSTGPQPVRGPSPAPRPWGPKRDQRFDPQLDTDRTFLEHGGGSEGNWTAEGAASRQGDMSPILEPVFQARRALAMIFNRLRRLRAGEPGCRRVRSDWLGLVRL
jgi:hypothetical protein